MEKRDVYPPAQYPPAQYPPAQYPPAQYPPAQYPTQRPPSDPPAYFSPAVQYPGWRPEATNVPIQVVNTTQPPTQPPAQPPTQPSASETYNPRYPPQQVNEATGCGNQKNRPQSNSVSAVSTIFISGGMKIAWSCLNNTDLTFTMVTHLRICWFAAAIIGALCSAVLTNFIPKKLIFLVSSMLVLCGGIFFLLISHNPEAVAAALYFDGIGNGLAIVPMLIMAGEEIIPEIRGRITSIVEMKCFTFGFFLQTSIAILYITYFQYASFGATKLHGLLSIIFGAIAFLMSVFVVVESPVYYLQRDDEDSAIESQRRLQRPFVVTHETYRLLNENKNYVNANRSDPYTGLLALLKVCIYRGLVALAFSQYTTKAMAMATFYRISHWPYVIGSLLLWIGSLVAGCIIDSAGRKKPMLLGAVVCGAMACGISAILSDNFYFLYPSKLDAAMSMLFVLGFFGGLFISSAPVYTTEAFPLRLKPYYVATAFIVQMVVSMIVGASSATPEDISSYFTAMGVLYLLFFLMGLVAMPETKGRTLREAQVEFKNLLNVRIYYN